MIVTLFFVAAAMMAGGAWAVFTGWELIIIERGWTQVLLGGMLLTGGLLLAGVGVLAVHVKRLAGKLEHISTAKPSPITAAAPAKREEMPPPPPRHEPRPAPQEEPRLQVEPVPVATPAEETAKPAAPAMSAPAAIALGAAAGAGTAAVASAILSTSTEARSPVEDEAAERVSSERLFADIEEPAAPTPGDEIMPTPDGEDRDMVLMPESADADAEATPEDEEHVVPPVEEIARFDDAPEATERAPSAVEEEPYSAPTEERIDDAFPDMDEPSLPPETTPDIAESLVDEERAVGGTVSIELAQEVPEVEALHMEEEPLMEGEPRLEDLHAQERLSEPSLESVPPEEPEMAEPVSRDEGVPEEVAEPEPAPRSVVGTYESGGNVYTMYSDGSIDARTPSGEFHFASLDELKNFIAEGGEDPLT